MISVLEDLYYGNVNPCERTLADTEKANTFRELQHALTPIEKQLTSALSEQQLMLFHTFCNMQSELVGMEQESIFISAFRLGAKLMTEVLLPSENNLFENPQG
mgnify:CR=1 FL=1